MNLYLPAFPYLSAAFWFEKYSSVTVKLFTKLTTPLQSEKQENTLWGYFSKEGTIYLRLVKMRQFTPTQNTFNPGAETDWKIQKMLAKRILNFLTNHLTPTFEKFVKLHFRKCQINVWLAYFPFFWSSIRISPGRLGTDDTWTLHKLHTLRSNEMHYKLLLHWQVDENQSTLFIYLFLQSYS